MIVPRSLWVHRFFLLACLVLVAGVGLGFWAYQAVYLPRYGFTENALLSADNIIGFQTTEKVILRVRLLNSGKEALRGRLHVALTDPKGRVLGDRDKIIDQTEPTTDYRVEIRTFPLAADQITLQCSLGRQQLMVPLSRVLAVKVHETSLTASRELIAGTPAALRCGVHMVQSLGGEISLLNSDPHVNRRSRKRTVVQHTPETSPLIGAEVRVHLRAKDGTIHTLHQGLTGNDGWDQAAFSVPAVPPGAYTLQVTTRSERGEDHLEQPVRVVAPAAILLATDKTLYRPGQAIHVRARACRSFDRKPLAGAALAVTVADARGKPIFQHSQPTTADGSAAVDCPLAETVPVGEYRVRVTLGEQQTETTVAVRRPARPRFKVNVTADKSYYLPGETIHAEAQVDYSAGRPVVGAVLKVAAVMSDDADDPFTTWEGDTDQRGHARWDIKLPKDFGTQGRAEVRLEVQATDLAEHTETVQRSFPVSDQPIQVYLIPEGGQLVPDLENRVYIAAIYPDGRPAPCAVIVRQGKDSRSSQFLTRIPTSPAGLAEFRFTPRKAYMRLGPRRKFVKEMLGNRQEIELTPELVDDFIVEAGDDDTRRATAHVTLNCNPLGENLILRLDRTLYQPGDTLNLQVLTTPGLTRPYVDVVRDGQLVLTRNLTADAGVAEARLQLPAGVVGTLEVHAYQMINTGQIFRDTRVIYVAPPTTRHQGPPAKGVPPADRSGRIRFQTTSPGEPGKPAQGRIVVDDSAYDLPDLPPGLEKVYTTLQGEWLQPAGPLPAPPVGGDEVVTRQQQVAGALLAAVRPRPPHYWVVEPVVQRHYRAYDQARQIAWGIFAYARSGRPFMDYEPQTRRWTFRPNLLQEMIAAGALKSSLLDGPFGNRLILADLSRWETNFTVDRVAELVTWERWLRLIDLLVKYTEQRPQFHQAGRWVFPATILADAVRDQKENPLVLKDAWGEPTRLLRRPIKLNNKTGLSQFDFHELASAGPDRTWDTTDDLSFFNFFLRQRVEEPLFGINLADYLEGGPAPPEAPAAGRVKP